MSNTFGNIYRLTTFGESHGQAIGGVIDGMPAGLEIDLDQVQAQLDRRRPGQSELTSPRGEADRVSVLSGLLDGETTGAPIGFVIANQRQRPGDYSALSQAFRPSHADFTYTAKYGLRDHRGGGRASARETAARVVGGAMALQALARFGVEVYAYTSQIGDIKLDPDYRLYSRDQIEKNPVRCPDPEKALLMERLVRQVKAEGDTIGGVVTGVIKGAPAGLGEPVFGKLHAMLGAAMLGINAAKGFEYGLGFDFATMRGSQVNDPFTTDGQGRVRTVTNNSGGIQGGISNGEDIYFRVAFKPVATLMRDTATIDRDGGQVLLKAGGRHDPCVLPRAVPVVEAMAAMTTLDAYLMNRSARLM